MKLCVNDVVELRDGKIVRIMEVKGRSCMYPVWFVDTETGVTVAVKSRI